MRTSVVNSPVAGAVGAREPARPQPAQTIARSERSRLLLQVVTAVLASAVVAVALARTDRWYLAVGAVAGLGLVTLGFRRPALFLLLFLLVRPLLDEVSSLTLGIPGANVAGLMAGLLMLLTLALLIRRPSALAWPPAGSFAALVAITGGLSLLAIWDFGATVRLDPITEVVRLLSVLAMYLLAANVFNTADRLRKLVIVAGVSGLVPAIWGLVELPTLTTTEYAYDVARISGPFVGPNALGIFLATTCLIVIGMPRPWLSGRVRLLVLVPQVVALVPTYSRVGWILLIVGVTVLEFRQRKRLIIAMVVVVAAVLALVPTVNQRVFPSSTPTPNSAPTYESYDWRIDNWRTLLQMWTERPLTGYGTKTTIYVNPRRTTERQLAPDGGFEAHNSVVRILVEGGLALLAAYLLWAIVLFKSLRAMRRHKWPLLPVARLLGILWLLFALVAVATDDPFDSTVVLFMLFAMTGGLEGAFRAWRRTRSTEGRDDVPQLFLPARPESARAR